MANPIIPRVVDGVCVCAVCCVKVWESEYDCGTGTWTTNPIPVSKTLVGGECPPDVTWAPTDDPCIYEYIQYNSIELCEDCSDSPDVLPDPDEPIVNPPPGCCGESCCFTLYTAEFTCGEPGSWAVETLATICAPCDSTDPFGLGISAYVNAWEAFSIFGPGCTWYYASTDGDTCVEDEDCSEQSAPVPPDPGLYPPPGCCNCARWYVDSVFDCDTYTWGEPNYSCIDPDVPCEADLPWASAGFCAADRYMWTPDCGTPPAGGLPDLYPPGCCEGDCCYTLWASTWDCDTETWGTVGIYDQFDGFPCDITSSDWYYGPDGTCLAFFTQYSPEGDCPTDPPDAPPPPTLAAPPYCCGDPCVDCASAQPTATNIAVVGANSCGFPAGSAAFSGFGAGVDSCFWAWNQPGAADTWTVSVQYNNPTNDWLVTVIRNDAFSTNRYDTFPFGSITCVGGNLQSGVLTLTSAGGGALCAVGDFFQVQFG